MNARQRHLSRYRQANATASGSAEELITAHRWIVPYVVERMRVALPDSVEREELVGAGSLGLVQAAHGFDPSRGCEFSTFAFERVRGAILDSLRQRDPLSRENRRRLRELQRFEDQFRLEHGRDPSDEEVTEQLELQQGQADELRVRGQAARLLSLDEPAREGQDPLRSLLASERGDEDPGHRAAAQERFHALSQALLELPEREREVVTLYYFGGHLLKEIASAMNVSAARVSQLHARALSRLRRALQSPSSPKDHAGAAA